MTELLTAAQMQTIERAAIGSGQVAGLELMERAGRGVVDASFEKWPEMAKKAGRSVVFCGPGNNGGDGFVVARLLLARGWEVEVFLYGDPEKLPPDARANYERVAPVTDVKAWSASTIAGLTGYDMYVDAIFGAGLTRAPAAEILEPLVQLHVSGETFGRMVCVDAPTGLCMDSGRALCGEFGAVHGFLTVTFHRQRPGQFLQDGPLYCGSLRLVDIGLSGAGSDAVKLTERPAAVELAKAGDDHKYSHGHALILSGGFGKTGAARLAGRGALRIGAGLVTLGVPPSAQLEVASQITALMLRRVEGDQEFRQILRDERLNALCLGPGMGLDRARNLVPEALSAKRATVLDADALTAYADDPESLFAQLHENCILTPHWGEFTRLFPDIAVKLTTTPDAGPAYSKVDATREAAARVGCVVLFKGPDTVIAAPDGRCSINSALYDRAAPWLATAGSGDVLAGFVTGLLARDFPPMRAAEIAAWLHVECARQFGPGLIAEDLPDQLPAVFDLFGV